MLTSKSTSQHLADAIADGTLLDIGLTLPVGRTTRRILAPPDLHARITQEASWPLKYRQATLLADLDHFLLGKPITFSTGRERTCRMKVLDPWTEEVWELRSRGEKPGARVLGRFAEPNCYIALCMEDRDELDFKTEIRRCKAEWRKVFHTFPPYSALSPSDYITVGLVDLRPHE